jgi:hypothetical protein
LGAVSALTLPFELPARVARRAADDLGAIANIARELPTRLDELDARIETMQLQLDRALTLGESIESHGSAMVDLGGRMEIHGEALLEIGARIAERGGEIAAALPALERAVAIATPLEGTVERLGRALDRLPGGRPRGPEQLPPEGSRPGSM